MTDISKKIGILGGGQLGKMLTLAGARMGLNISCLDPSPESPASQVCPNYQIGDFKNYADVIQFAKDKDIITIEIENVNTDALKHLEQQGKTVFPQAHIIELIKDKGLQKEFYKSHNIPTSDFELFEDKEAILRSKHVVKNEFPFVQKMCVGGYDGKGVQVIKSKADLSNVFDGPSIIEDMVDIEKELAVIVARNEHGHVSSYPLVEMVFDNQANLLDYLFSPAKVSDAISQKATEISENLAKQLEIVGLLAIELFLTKDGQILVNEVAPRTHNSGHHTIEANYTSQFEQQLRAILGLPLGDTGMKKSAIMMNLLGDPNFTGPTKVNGIDEVLSIPATYPHIYGKKITKPYRKMGHLTLLYNDYEQAIKNLDIIKSALKIQS